MRPNEANPQSPPKTTGATPASSSKHVDEPPVSGHRIPVRGSFVSTQMCLPQDRTCVSVGSVGNKSAEGGATWQPTFDNKSTRSTMQKLCWSVCGNAIQTGFPAISNQPTRGPGPSFLKISKEKPGGVDRGTNPSMQGSRTPGHRILRGNEKRDTQVTPNRGSWKKALSRLRLPSCEQLRSFVHAVVMAFSHAGSEIFAVVPPECRTICQIHQPRGRSSREPL
ncbi:hypothetical protein BDP55DRAFT_352241 [Colletotrichum godetiae]|uniref:Uncharacterized protein n=1 Tax=Colletotrichum godetiae TaxID=1209918 RepID=A0AAJ0AU98_9PEZI|nr:uncharacterized protein BDP55DRAFT_352241 [Colletotrichum godetiae]KAK1690486.1 hypothetical protein BDP55DRAFT_352241 [Colletotrichum godetiae]